MPDKHDRGLIPDEDRQTPHWFSGVTMQNFIVSAGLLGIGAMLTLVVNSYLAGEERAQKVREAVIAAEAKVSQDAATSDAALKARIAKLESDLSLLHAAVEPISVVMQKLLIEKLTHYHTPIMDALMVKLGPPNMLTAAEEKELHVALEERTRDMGHLISEDERNAAGMLPYVIVMVKRQAKLAASEQGDVRKIKVVTVAEPQSEAAK